MYTQTCTHTNIHTHSYTHTHTQVVVLLVVMDQTVMRAARTAGAASLLV